MYNSVSKPCYYCWWYSLSFKCKKSSLGPEFEGPLGHLAQAGSIYCVCTLFMSIWSTCGSETDSEWQIYDPFCEDWPFIWQSLKEFHFLVTHSGAPSQNFVSSIVEILFPHIYWPVPGMPSYNWLQHTYVTSCHTTKTRRIRLTVALFSWFTTK